METKQKWLRPRITRTTLKLLNLRNEQATLINPTLSTNLTETKSTTRRDIYEYEVKSSGATWSNRIEVIGNLLYKSGLKSSQQFCREAFHIANILIGQQVCEALGLYSDEEIVVMTARDPKSLCILEKEFKSQGDD